jgi:hypothetical protein
MTLFIEVIRGFLLVGMVITLFLALKQLYNLFKIKASDEVEKFADNTLFNYARVSGITKSGKITHHKHSCGGACIQASCIDEKSLDKSTTFSIKFDNPAHSFVIIPQTRLHGGGWIA